MQTIIEENSKKLLSFNSDFKNFKKKYSTFFTSYQTDSLKKQTK